MRRSFSPVGHLLGIVPLAVSPGCAFLRHSSLGLVQAGNGQPKFGKLSIVERGGAAAVAFSLPPDETPPDVMDAARRGNLAARAVGESPGDVAIISAVELIRADGRPTVWPGEFPKESVSDEMQMWWQPVFLACMGIRCSRVSRSTRARRADGRGIMPLRLHGEIDAAVESRLSLDIKFARGKNLELEIDSPGGDAAKSIGLNRALARHDARVIASITGQASSGAALVAMAADERHIDRGATMLLHRPVITGNTAAPYADQLEVISEVMSRMAEIIADGTGQTRATARRWLNADLVFSADMALQAGLVTSIVNSPTYLEAT